MVFSIYLQKSANQGLGGASVGGTHALCVEGTHALCVGGTHALSAGDTHALCVWDEEILFKERISIYHKKR